MARVPSSNSVPGNRRRFGRKKPKREGPGTFAQIRETYKIARKHDKLILVWPTLAILGTIGIGVGLGVVFNHLILVPLVAAVKRSSRLGQ